MSETIIFFGSGPVASRSLELLNEAFTIEGVITKPRPEGHKGPVPVLETAEHLGLPVHTASNRETLERLFDASSFTSRLAVLIDFGIIVPQSVIERFPLGIINSHFSLLPLWRGADPITFTILSGEQQTGVSLMLLVAGLDEGPLIAQSPLRVLQDATTPSLTTDLIELSYEMLAIILPKYADGSIAPQPQDTSITPTYSRKLTKEDGLIDWQKPAVVIEREVRAFLGWPQSYTRLGDVEVIITKAHAVEATGQPGVPSVIDKQLTIFCGEGALVVDAVKPVGKREMTGSSFLAGYTQRLKLS